MVDLLPPFFLLFLERKKKGDKKKPKTNQIKSNDWLVPGMMEIGEFRWKNIRWSKWVCGWVAAAAAAACGPRDGRVMASLGSRGLFFDWVCCCCCCCLLFRGRFFWWWVCRLAKCSCRMSLLAAGRRFHGKESAGRDFGKIRNCCCYCCLLRR